MIGQKILLVEGLHDVLFFKELLKYLEIFDVGIYQYKGKKNFKNEFPSIKNTPGFKNVKIIAIVMDADENSDGAFESICGTLRRYEKTPPIMTSPPVIKKEFTQKNPKIGVYIMPDNNSNGALEDLCLKTVEGHDKINCVEYFWKCVSKFDECPKNPSKAKVQAFLASMPECAEHVGRGAEKSYWEFESKELNELKQFLSTFNYNLVDSLQEIVI